MGKFDIYKIDLKGMRDDLAEYEYILDSDYFTYIGEQELQEGKVVVELTVKRGLDVFELDFQISGVVSVPCDRCLENMDLPISSNERLIVKFGRTYSEEADNLIVIPEEEGVINVAWLMYEFIVLAVPMRHVHAPGECNKDMAAKLSRHLRIDAAEEELEEDEFLNEEDSESGSEVKAAEIDPRWNELRKILDNN